MARRMITLNNMITSRAVWTFTRILAVNNVTNRQDAMAPFEKEVGSAVVAVAYKGIDSPIDITGKGPVKRGYDVVAHGFIEDQVK